MIDTRAKKAFARTTTRRKIKTREMKKSITIAKRVKTHFSRVERKGFVSEKRNMARLLDVVKRDLQNAFISLNYVVEVITLVTEPWMIPMSLL